MNSAQVKDALHLINTLQQQGLTNSEVQQRLTDNGLTPDTAKNCISEWEKQRKEKKRNAAFVYCGIGVFLLTTGFLFTLLLFNSKTNFSFALYGLTIIGLVLVFKGMIDLLS